MSNENISSDEWYALNRTTAEIYNTSFDNLFSAVLSSIKELVPYSHSLTYLIRCSDENNTFFNMRSSDIPEEYLRLYNEKYAKLDFINWYSISMTSEVFRESDIIPDSLREKSVFMRDWMTPIGIYYGLGMNVSQNDIKYGAIFIYRAKEERNFSDKEVEILRIINHHLGLRLNSLYPDGLNSVFVRNRGGVGSTSTICSLTKREKEIVDCIRHGFLRSDLCDRLFITENTLNKHLDNIYKKFNINSYEELLQLIKQKS